MLTAIPVTKNNFHEVKALYLVAFPKQEQVPFPFLVSKTKNPNMQFLAYYHDTTFVGLTYTVTHEDITYLWYLATDSNLRSQGYGSQIMQHLAAIFPQQRIVLNLDVEDPTAKDSEIRKKRKQFYINNGYQTMPYKCNFNGNKLDIMTINGTLAPEEFAPIFKKFFGPILYLFHKPKILK